MIPLFQSQILEQLFMIFFPKIFSKQKEKKEGNRGERKKEERKGRKEGQTDREWKKSKQAKRKDKTFKIWRTPSQSPNWKNFTKLVNQIPIAVNS